MFRAATGDDANIHLMNFVRICTSQEIPRVNQIATRLRIFALSLTQTAMRLKLFPLSFTSDASN